jgi:hypothetical protein
MTSDDWCPKCNSDIPNGPTDTGLCLHALIEVALEMEEPIGHYCGLPVYVSDALPEKR